MAVTIEDVESRTLLQQFHELYRKNANYETQIENVDGKVEQEIQDRTDADYELSQDIADLQSQLDALGNVFTLKGSVDTVAELPAENNNVGDVWYVVENSSGYVWIDDDGTERWEQLGLTVDLSNYATQDDLTNGLATKQNTLTAGTNVSIIGDTISMVGQTIKDIVYDNSLSIDIHITNQDNGIYAIKNSLSANSKVYYNGESGTEYIEIPTNTLSTGKFYYMFVTKKQISLTMTWLWYIIYIDDSGTAKFASGTTTASSGTASVQNLISTIDTSNVVTLDNTAQEFTSIKELKFNDNGYLQLRNKTLAATNITFTPANDNVISIRKQNYWFTIQFDTTSLKWKIIVNNSYKIAIPEKTVGDETMALTSDIPSSITKTYGSGFSQLGGLTVERDIVGTSATNGNYIHHILLKYESTYQWTTLVNFEIVVETNSDTAFTTSSFASWLNTNGYTQNDASHTYKIPSFVIPSTANVGDNCFGYGLYSTDGTSISIWYNHNYYNLTLA